jgi:hypothetical protein
MQKIVLDMDGVIVGTKRVSHYPDKMIWILILLFHWCLLFLPSRFSRSFFKRHKVYVISNRPRFCEWVTKLWFKVRKYPVESVHCLGFHGDKDTLAKNIGPDMIIDDKKENFPGSAYLLLSQNDI